MQKQQYHFDNAVSNSYYNYILTQYIPYVLGHSVWYISVSVKYWPTQDKCQQGAASYQSQQLHRQRQVLKG